MDQDFVERRIKRFVAIALLMFSGSLLALDRVAGALRARAGGSADAARHAAAR